MTAPSRGKTRYFSPTGCANLFAAPGTVTVGKRAVTITLAPAGTPAELRAFDQVFAQLNALPLVMSGDPTGRRMRFRLQKQ